MYLYSKIFELPFELASYVNEHDIPKDNIESVCYNGAMFVLFYWE